MGISSNQKLKEINSCFICDAVKGHYKKIEDIPLFRNDDMLVFTGSGALIKNHCIVSPSEHVRSFANLSTESRASFVDLFNAMKKTTHKEYGDFITICEKGMNNEVAPIDATVHAHNQIFPNVDPEELLWNCEKTLDTKFKTIDYVNDLHQMQNKNYLGLFAGDKFYVHDGEFPRRFFRSEVCKMKGLPPSYADYKEAFGLKNNLATIKHFKVRALEHALKQKENFLNYQ